MNEIKKLHTFYLHKEINRRGKVKDRFESSAEHTYSALILAQYFLPKIKQKLNELKVMKMLLYHDVIEIEFGDTFILSNQHGANQKERETTAFEKLKKKIPLELAKEYEQFWEEYEENKTIEAKFAQAIDKLDPVVHSIFKKVDWRVNKFTEKKLREKKEKYFVEFPELVKFFNELIDFANERDYFS